MEIGYGQYFISELSEGITYKSAAGMTIIETLLSVDGLCAIKGGYC